MQTVAVNGLTIIWVSVLVLAPGLAIGSRRGTSAVLLAATSAITLSALSFVTFLTSELGYGTIAPLRVCAGVLGASLLFAVIQTATATRARRLAEIGGAGWSAAWLGVGVGVWMLVPPLLELARLGSRFGLATIFNADVANYALAAENVAAAGFRDSHHIANGDYGSFSQHASYMGATALIVFASAATGLAIWQVTMAAMGVAICLSAVALWALTEALWPDLRNGFAAGVVCIAAMASLSTFLVAEFFLAGALGGASVVTALAGATALAKGASRSGFLALAGGGALGVYCYGHIGLPVGILLPFWTVSAAALLGPRRAATLLGAAVRSIAGVLVAALLSSIAIDTAVSLVKSQSTVVAGFPLPPLDPTASLVWPAGIGHQVSQTRLGLSWLLVAAACVAALGIAWRNGRTSAVLSSALAIAGVVVIAGTIAHYGSDRYQTWKMESLLMPILLVAVVPATRWVLPRRPAYVNAFISIGVGAVLLGPSIVWQPVSANPAPSVITSSAMTALSRSPALSRLASVNVRLAPFFQTMAVAAIIPTPAIVMSSATYEGASTSLQTCTLTTRSLLAPGERDFTDLGGGYVLLQRPHACAVRR